MANKTITGDGSGGISCTTSSALNSLEIDGESTQDGTPTPDDPQEITSIEEIHITIADGTGRKQEVEIDLDTPLRSVGSIHDTLELDGTITRNIGVNDYTLNRISITSVSWGYRYQLTLSDWIYSDSTECLCDKFAYNSTAAQSDGLGIRMAPSARTLVALADEEYTTANESVDITLYGILATPTTETLPAADIAALAALKTYFGHTNVSITDQDGNDISWVIGYTTYDTTGHPKLDYVNGGVM